MWQHIFDLQLSVGEKVLRALLIYVFLVLAIRIVGVPTARPGPDFDLTYRRV